MNKKAILYIVCVILLIGTGLFIYRNVSLNPQYQEATPSGQSTSTVPSGIMQTERDITANGQNFSFTPASITVNKGDKVKIIFKNTAGFHDLRIDEFNVATPRIGSGQETVVEFTADKTGSFEYYCSVGDHRVMGMWGTLIVR